MFRAFKYKNFRLFFSGLLISQIGVWIQNVAINWLIYDITGSPYITGVSTFITTIPLFFFTPVAGTILDKFNKHKLLILLQILFLIQAFIITFLYYTDTICLKYIVISGFFMNMLLSTDGPLRQSLFIDVVDNKEDLTNAISTNSSCFNLVKLIGPAIAGLIITHFNVGICFLVNFICIIPNIVLVSLMKLKDSTKKDKKSFFVDLKDGLCYVFKTPKIYYLQIFLAIFCSIAMIYPMLMPIYTKNIFYANADLFGFLMASIGLGALVSSLTIASLKDNKNLKAIMISACFLLCLCFVLLGFIKNIVISLIIAFFMGLSITGFITPQISLLQLCIDNDFRGRVMSYNTICILGISSFSTIISGTVIDKIGILNTFFLYSFILFVSGLYLGWKLINTKY